MSFFRHPADPETRKELSATGWARACVGVPMTGDSLLYEAG